MSKEWRSLEHQKNEIKLKLLTILPYFQEDVKRIRQELNIPPTGFNNEENLKRWYDAEIIEKSDEIIGSREFRKAVAKLETIKNYPDYLKQKWGLNDKIPLFRMAHRKEMLGKKYKLPANFYENQLGGLLSYITRNELRPPSNNWIIEQDPEGRKGTTKWFAIKIFSPLSKKELKDATKMLKSLQKHYFPKGLVVNSRIKKQFDRDLIIFRELVLERDKKPIKRKKYSGYLSYIKDPKERQRWEKLYPSCIEIGFDTTTSREIAKRLNITPDAVRQTTKRLKTLIRVFFGEEYIGR